MHGSDCRQRAAYHPESHGDAREAFPPAFEERNSLAGETIQDIMN